MIERKRTGKKGREKEMKERKRKGKHIGIFLKKNKYVLASRLLMHICFTIFIQQNKYPWPVFAKLYKDIQNNDT